MKIDWFFFVNISSIFCPKNGKLLDYYFFFGQSLLIFQKKKIKYLNIVCKHDKVAQKNSLSKI
jgi:hypothetical protein